MKRTANRVIARLAMFLIAIVLGAIAVAQAQRGVEARRNAAAPTQTVAQQTNVPAIPLEEKLNPQPIPDDALSSSEPDPRKVEPTTSETDDFGPPPAYAAEPPVYNEPSAATESTPVRPAEFADDSDDFAANPLPMAPPAPATTAPETAPPTLPPADFAPAPQMQVLDEPNYEPAAPAYEPAAPAESGFDASQDSHTMRFPDNTDSYQVADDNYTGRATITVPESPPAPLVSQPPVTRSPTTILPPAQPDYGAANDATRDYSLEPSYAPQSPLVAAGEEGVGKPGPAELEGPQTPALTIVKKSPPEVQVGKPAKFHITVRNNGQVSAHDVLIRDEIPHGTRLIGTNPPATRAADGALLWQMGSLRPGAEVTTMMEVMPTDEGDIGSVATVSFQTSASARSIATLPQLMLEHSTDPEVLVGDEVIFHIKLSNAGSGVATNVVIEEDVPRGLQHYDGNELEYQIGDIKPGETRMLELKLKADEAGLCENVLIAKADGNIAVEDRCQVEIVAPQIQLEFTGPRRRFLERRANYEIHVANPGTAPARNVELVAHLPRALKFVSTNNAGKYDAQRHIVIWNLTELPAQEMGTVELAMMPVQMGNHSIQVEARASSGLADAVEHDVLIEGLVALLYTVTDVSDPIEVGGQTTYEIHVVNQGSKMASNLRIGAMIPSGMEAINGEGPTRVTIDGPRVIFDPLPRLAPQADTFYKIHVKGTHPGDKRIQVQMVSDDVSEPVTKEESTHVYTDE